MTLFSYLKDRLFVVVAAALCACGCGAMMAVIGQSADAVVLAACFVLCCAATTLAIDYARVKAFWCDLEDTTQCSDRACHIVSLVDRPRFLEGRLAYDALESMGRKAADEVAVHRRQAEAYRDYIELWIHEIKTPIAAASLMAASLHGVQAARIEGELDRIDGYVEQALYYARSTSVSQDYAIREISLADVVRTAVKKQARYLISRKTIPIIDIADDEKVFADAKWLAFMIGQIAVNSAKYGARTLRFSTSIENGGSSRARTVLEVADDGCGVAASDVPRVFERGFTGENGRSAASSTGMGLYLVAELCEKMGLAVAFASDQGVGTRVLLAFPHDRRRLDSSR